MRLCTEYAYLPAIDADGRKQGQERMEISAPALRNAPDRRRKKTDKFYELLRPFPAPAPAGVELRKFPTPTPTHSHPPHP